MKRAIGIIDSGVGGMTVAREVMRQLPKEKIYYLGDTARCPYGPRQFEEVRTFTWNMIHYLLGKDIKLLVIACNTATAAVLDEAQRTLSIPVVGVIHPGARAAIKVSMNREIGVIGTEGTVASRAYVQALHSIDSKVNVHSLACPEFVPLVESGMVHERDTKRIVYERLAPLTNLPIDTLILGCTHYPILKPVIEEVMGSSVSIISSGSETAREVSTILYYSEQLNKGDQLPEHRFFTTGPNQIFNRLTQEWFDQSIKHIEHIEL
ncbi:glutamate racemase [Pseudalkalibacillus berkeleyi]|uniref:Glutamate racemase n=1 Tax=Pseudalkalibacillus berkeleyi TaxID=1069813 RepID=A0ABS9H2Q4_9BACL|nr:glutamate racemase [Pseudalkalibacillus berkeleyi]MCF6138138.1 glutamate racemase [Pseudalkalibacillus berkeleyi]